MQTFKYSLILSTALILSACASHHSAQPESAPDRPSSASCDAAVTQIENLNGQTLQTVIGVWAQAKTAASDAMAECLDQNLVIECASDICLIAERMKE